MFRTQDQSIVFMFNLNSFISAVSSEKDLTLIKEILNNTLTKSISNVRSEFKSVEEAKG